MKEHGINLIIADSMEEIDQLKSVLGVGQVSALKSIEQMIFVDPDATFYSILRTKTEMERLAAHFSIRRGVISYKGERQLVGFNIDWMKKIIANPRAQAANEEVVRHLNAALPKEYGSVIQQPLERDDPYVELGYRR